MKTKNSVDLARITMQSLALCPFFVVIKDESKNSGVNIITISYVGVLSEKPPIIGLAIRPGRYSHGLLMKNREFTLNLPKISILDWLDYCGSISGKEHDKVDELKIELEKSEIVDVSCIKASPINLECRIREILFFSKEDSSHDYFIADVVAARRLNGFELEKENVVVTTNYDYRKVGNNLGRACKKWRNADVQTKGGKRYAF